MSDAKPRMFSAFPTPLPSRFVQPITDCVPFWVTRTVLTSLANFVGFISKYLFVNHGFQAAGTYIYIHQAESIFSFLLPKIVVPLSPRVNKTSWHYFWEETASFRYL
jgi:hypothetical protein